MKSLITACILFLVMLIGIGFNAVYIHEVSATLVEQLENLPPLDSPDCSTATQHLNEYWKENISYVHFSVAYPTIDHIGEQIAILSACVTLQDRYGFQSTRELLLDAAKDLCRAERFSAENLL